MRSSLADTGQGWGRRTPAVKKKSEPKVRCVHGRGRLCLHFVNSRHALQEAAPRRLQLQAGKYIYLYIYMYTVIMVLGQLRESAL
jgi:hypothetical protein